ncbi:MAG TPA: hypothetical protein VHX63_02065 [Acidobacteriaceae bacterium]|jgi:hypothetical protein|nr:hypothetical protein [Acidobacteriaceae bacterium]
MSRDPAFPPIGRLVDIASRMLAPNEREAVRGDLAESGATGIQALRDVLGLALRRQAALWKDWRPWLALCALAIPLGLFLSLASRRTADISSIYLWMYANNWDWSFLGSIAFWHGLAACLPAVLQSCLVLICLSSVSGFLIASLSRRTLWVQISVFCLVLLFAGLPGAPQFLNHALFLQPARGFNPNRVVFALGFYRIIVPLLVQAFLVLLPFFWATRQYRNAAAQKLR